MDVLSEGAERVIQHRPGFVSVNLLTSNDGNRVVNLAQWESLDELKATMGDPDAGSYAKQAAELAQATPHVYTVAAVYHA